MREEGTGQDPSGGGASPEDPRLTRLDQRLRAAGEAEQARAGASRRGPDTGYSQGSRVLAELIAGPAGGALIGWLLDSWLGTRPWLLLALMVLGIAVAFRNIMRISGERPK